MRPNDRPEPRADLLVLVGEPPQVGADPLELGADARVLVRLAREACQAMLDRREVARDVRRSVFVRLQGRSRLPLTPYSAARKCRVAAWRDAAAWRELVDGTTCPFCTGEPRGLVAETPTSWVTTEREVACRGYLCVIARRHVVEPFELPPDELARFFGDVAHAAAAIDELFRPVKLNYEIHGNTIPHLHLHVFPRYVGDPFEDGPIRSAERTAVHTSEDLARIRERVGAALE